MKDDTQRIVVCGTAFSVESESNDILLSAGHVIVGKQEGFTFHCASNVTRTGNTSDPLTWRWARTQGEVFPVEIVLATLSPDIAVLRRSDGCHCKSAIPLCNPLRLPWVVRPADWACKAYTFHCPATVVDDVSVEYADQLGCEVDEVVVRSSTAHHCTLDRAFLPGSSGGAVVLSDGSLLGIVVKRNVSGSMYVQDVRFNIDSSRDKNNETQEKISEDKGEKTQQRDCDRNIEYEENYTEKPNTNTDALTDSKFSETGDMASSLTSNSVARVPMMTAAIVLTTATTPR